MEHYGMIAVGYPPPLVLNVEQPANLHRFLELQLNTGREALQCQLFNPVYSAAKAGERVIRRLAEHGGVTSRKDRLSWRIGALFRMIYGCLTLTDVALSVCELAVELQLSAATNPRTLLRSALIRVGVILQEFKKGGEDERVLEDTCVSLYRMLGGLWSCYLKPPRG